MASPDAMVTGPPRSELVGIGYLNKGPGSGVTGRDLKAYALVYLIDGGGYFSDETQPERAVRSGDVLVLFPGKRHSYFNGDQPTWTEIWLVCRGGIFSQLEREGVLDRSRPVLHPGLVPALLEAFDGVHATLANGDWRDGPGLVARAHHLCTEVVRLDQAGKPDAGLAEQACALLADALHRPLDLRHVAGELGMGYEAFRKFFAHATGQPPARWRQLKRIELARRMLLEEPVPLAAIAQRLGYCDEYFFNRQFTRVTGISPARYRRDFAHGVAIDTASRGPRLPS
jgi:AraC-like DNA-binding protein